MNYLFKKIFFFLLVVALFTSCEDQWEDHNALNHAVLAETLDQMVSTTPSVSKFYEYIKKAGYDKILASSKVFTVWAPSNDALSNLDQSIVNDSAKLSQFVGNHIAYQEYSIAQTMDIKIKMINGKILTYTYLNKKIDNIQLDTLQSDRFCKNGILHVVNAPIYPKASIWEYVQGISDPSFSNINSFFDKYMRVFDPINSKRIGTDSLGNAVYDTVWIHQNIFLSEFNDVSNEDSTFTLFVLSNDTYHHEFDKMRPYLTDTTSNQSANLTDWNAEEDVFKDIVVRGKYTINTLPETFYSTKGIKINKADLGGTIVSQYDASNGSVIMVSGSNGFNVQLNNKISPVVIEGENYYGKFDGLGNSISVSLLGIRARAWASGGKDLNVTGGTNGHKTPWLTIEYYTQKLYSVKYNVYWRVINDFQSSSFTQKIAINIHSISQLQDTTLQLFKFKTVPVYDPSTLNQPYSATETLLGSWTNVQFGIQRFFLVANNANSGAWNDPLSLDYFKLVPVLN